jgi:arabinogalactan endo-1,4-beta-galactosidase
MNLKALFFSSFLIACTSTPTAPTPSTKLPLRGTDFSQLLKVENEGFQFYDCDSNGLDALEILSQEGINIIRLKVWNNPSGDASLQELVPFAQRIKAAGMQIMLTLHYSNTWADPGAQSVPSQWNGLSFESLLDSVNAFTFKVVNTLHPEYVQIGNEINHGLMHPYGLRDGDGEFQRLLDAGIRGAHQADSSCITILHYAGYVNADEFYKTVDTLDYDWIGLSYYPKWHGTSIATLKQTLFQLTDSFGRPSALVETSYPWTLQWADWTDNHVGSANDLHPDFPATPEGQAAFIQTLREITDSLGTGLLYWGGELVAYKGPQSQDGSPYENQALFNFNGVAVRALRTLGHP